MTTREQQLAWAHSWASFDKDMLAIARAELRSANLWETICGLNDAYSRLIVTEPSHPTSGLVDQQALFHKAQSAKSI